MTLDELTFIVQQLNKVYSGDHPVRIEDVRGVVQEVDYVRTRIDGHGNRSVILKGVNPL